MAKRPNANCVGQGNSVPYEVQAFRVTKPGVYSFLSTQNQDGFLVLQQDYSDISNMNTSCLIGQDDYNNSGGVFYSYFTYLLTTGKDYFIASSPYANSQVMNFSTRVVGPGAVIENSALSTNTVPQMTVTGGKIYLKGKARADTTDVEIFDDKLCINKVNTGAQDLATFASGAGLETNISTTGVVTLYSRITDSEGVKPCTPIVDVCMPPTVPVAPTNLVVTPDTTTSWELGPTFTWTNNMISPCGGWLIESTIGTTSGGSEYASSWDNNGTANNKSINGIYPPGTYYFTIRTKTSTNSAVSSTLTVPFTVNLSANGVTYSGSVVSGDPTFYRPNAGFTTTHGSLMPYKVRSFTVDTTGTYKMGSRLNWDAFIYLYATAFDPAQPLVNIVTGNDDYNGTRNSYMTATLTAGVTYYFVTASYNSGSGGTYFNIIDGPGVITLNP